MAQTRPAPAVAGDARARDRQSCGRRGVEPGAIHPWAPTGSRRARRRHLEQGGVTPDLADDGMAAPQRGLEQRAAHVPGVEQQAQRAETVAHRPQQPLGQGDLPGVAGAAAQAGHDRHRARLVAAGDDGGERDEGLAQQEGRAVSLVPVVEPHRGAGRLGRAPRRQGVVDHGEASRPAGLTPDDVAQRGDQAEQPEPAPLQHPVVGLPAPPRR
jgi:hypothetical protein